MQHLERAGFVQRGPDATDGRVTLVAPTPASLVLRAQVERLWGKLERLTTGDLPADDRRDALRRLEANLSEALDPTHVHRP